MTKELIGYFKHAGVRNTYGAMMAFLNEMTTDPKMASFAAYLVNGNLVYIAKLTEQGEELIAMSSNFTIKTDISGDLRMS